MKEREIRPKEELIKEMPDKETLEAYLRHGPVMVYFDLEEGKFKWHERYINNNPSS